MKLTGRPWLVMIVLCLGTFATLLDSTIVNVALPRMITALRAPLDQAVWVVNAYLLVFCALLIVASRLGDIFGPRRLFITGLALFALASAACGAAQSPGELIAARVAQGIGAAAMAPQAMVIIQAVFPRDRLGAAYGLVSSMVGLAAVSGPTLGGLLTTYLSWRWVFYVNLPIAAVAIALAYRYVPEVRAGRRSRLDLVGALLATSGLSAVVYGLIEGQHYAWGRVAGAITLPEIIGAGVALLAGFAAWERRHAQPLVPLGLFRGRTFTIMVVLNLVVQFALQSMLLVSSINYQSVLGMTAVQAGLTGLPLTLALTTVSPFAGRLTDRFGGRYVLTAGLIVYAAGITGVAAVASARATSLTFIPVLLVAGLGMGTIFAPLLTIALRAVPPAAAGAASGVLNTSRQLGATLGGAVTGAVLASRLAVALHADAAARAGGLPAAARSPFIAQFTHVARTGLHVGPGQFAVRVPRGTSATLITQLHHIITSVFADGYITAMRYSLAIPVALLLAGAGISLLLRTPQAFIPDLQPTGGRQGPRAMPATAAGPQAIAAAAPTTAAAVAASPAPVGPAAAR